MEVEQARRIAEQYIQEKIQPPAGDRFVIVDASIKATDEGWFFGYQTSKYVETGDINYSVVGNCPVFINKHSGEASFRWPW